LQPAIVERCLTADPKTVPSLSDDPQLPSLAPHDSPPSAGIADKAEGSKWKIWLWRLRALLLVTTYATFGVLLVILPWTPKWTDNPLLLSSPELRTFVTNGFVRGLASGLGLLDLWLGFWEAIHYHE
jgi:hypothetical protein